MVIKHIRLNNFRCFANKTFSFDKKFVLIEGKNGSGKTSLLEGIYYSCYLKSFRTRLNRELVNFDTKHFFIKTDFDDNQGSENQIQVGYSGDDGKLVKFNKKPVQSYKQIVSLYKIICINENDLQLVGGAPEHRRSFLNQSLFLMDFDFVSKMREYKQTLEQRTRFLANHAQVQSLSSQALKELQSWTKQHWQRSVALQKKRKSYLKKLEKKVNELLHEHFFKDVSIKLEYVSKNIKLSERFDLFWKRYQADIMPKELRWVRSFFGFHIDDFSISFKKRKAKFYASRGQQKLILFLLKLSQLLLLHEDGEQGCFLLDDFLTDFDDVILSKSLNLLNNLDFQVFVTSPIKSVVSSKLKDIASMQMISMS